MKKLALILFLAALSFGQNPAKKLNGGTLSATFNDATINNGFVPSGNVIFSSKLGCGIIFSPTGIDAVYSALDTCSNDTINLKYAPTGIQYMVKNGPTASNNVVQAVDVHDDTGFIDGQEFYSLSAPNDGVVFLGSPDGYANDVMVMAKYHDQPPVADTAGNFTGTLTGVSGTVTSTFYFTISGHIATLVVPDITGTTNATTMTLSGLPSFLQPTRDEYVYGKVYTTATTIVDGQWIFSSGDDTITLSAATTYGAIPSTTAWASAIITKGVPAQTIVYSIDNSGS